MELVNLYLSALGLMLASTCFHCKSVKDDVDRKTLSWVRFIIFNAITQVSVDFSVGLRPVRCLTIRRYI